MKNIRPIILSISVILLWVWFFGIAWAQNYNYNYNFIFSSAQNYGFQVSTWIQKDTSYEFVSQSLKVIKDIYLVEDVIETLPFVVARNASILSNNISNVHSSADVESMYEIDPIKINDFLQGSESFESFYQKIRIDIVKFLFEKQYSRFNNQPYGELNWAILEQSWDFKIVKDIEEEDGLDVLLHNKLQIFKDDFDSLKNFEDYLNFKEIAITTGEYNQFWTLFMFKNEQDLRDLWYELISWKSRINTDRDYRIYNIKTAFNNIGNVRLIMPSETFVLGRELHYNPNFEDGNEVFVDWYATLWDSAQMVYGGWLCGVATAFYQGTLTNLWLDLLQYRAHSIYYRNLYEAEINGSYIKDPWLDATMFAPHFDVKVKNIRNYPIIVAFNFDGLSWSVEQVFTLSKPQDRGSFEYIWKHWKGSLQCFTWKINWEKRTNCYKHVKNF